MKKFFSKENIIGLLLLITAVAVLCCLLGSWYLLPHPKGGWQEKELPLENGLVCRISHKKGTLGVGGGGPLSSPEMDPGDGGGGSFSNGGGETGDRRYVQDGLVTDLDGDGVQELLLLLWKRGKYGPHKPFWENDEDRSYSQHLFIYEVSEDGKVREKWCTSDLGREILRFKLMEKNDSILLTEDVAGKCCLWRWESFGLKLMDNSVKLVAFGDNIIHREIYEYAENRLGGNYDFLYQPFYEEIESADIAAFQQESMLVDKEAAVSGYPVFGSPLAVGEAIAKAGFDVACCAGNHALDKGIYGIDVTTKFYEDKGILCLGVQNSADTQYRPYELINRNGITFALLNYTYGMNPGDGGGGSFSEAEMDPGDGGVGSLSPYTVHYLPGSAEKKGDMLAPANKDISEEYASLIRDIQLARTEADFVVVFVHWGDEYEKEISTHQKQVTEALAEGGADLVIGTHPHVVQEVKNIKRPDGGDMLVYYSLGNFRAHQGLSEDTMTGGEAVVFVEHCFDGARIADHELKEIDAFAP